MNKMGDETRLQGMSDKRAACAFSFRSKLELMPRGLRGGALPLYHIGFFFIQCRH